MTRFIAVAKQSEIPEGTARCVEVEGKRIGLFNLAGTIYALDDRCPHAEASLCEGFITGDEVACPLHMATFEIKTGRVTGPPADEDVRSYPVRMDGDEVQVGLED